MKINVTIDIDDEELKNRLKGSTKEVEEDDEETDYYRITWNDHCTGRDRWTVVDLWDLADRYGYVPVSDLLEIIGETPEYTDTKYGWTSSMILKAKLRYVGYRRWQLTLPYPMEIV